MRVRLFVRAAFPSAFRAVPQLPQNFARRAFSKPQLGQLFLSRAPHSVQNAIPAGFSEPQLGQRMSPLYCSCSRSARETLLLILAGHSYRKRFLLPIVLLR